MYRVRYFYPKYFWLPLLFSIFAVVILFNEQTIYMNITDIMT